MGVDSSGQLTYVLPLDLPKGLNGVEPKISLQYGYGQDSYLGFGFSLSGATSAIGRCASKTQLNERKSVRNQVSDEYCLDGQRMVRISGVQGKAGSVYTTEVDRFSRIVAVGDDTTGPLKWLLYDKDGYVSSYETADKDASGIKQSWYITTKEDRFGNTLKYDYQYFLNTLYLNTLIYGGNIVTFKYTDKTEPEKSGYKGGKYFEKGRLLVAIETSLVGKDEVHRYLLNYSASNLRSYSTQLESIRYCDNDYKCTPATKFKWQDRVYVGDLPVQVFNLDGDKVNSPMFVDINKDGETDLCVNTFRVFACALGPNFDFENPDYRLISYEKNGEKRLEDIRVIDLQNDGFPEICFTKEGENYSIICSMNENGIPNDDALVEVFTETLSVNAKPITYFMDINSDDFIDICRFYGMNVSNSFQCSINNGQGEFLSSNTYIGAEKLFYSNLYKVDDENRKDLAFIDVSGDGQPELCGISPYTDRFVCLENQSTGNSINLSSIKDIPSLNAPAVVFLYQQQAKKSFQYVEVNGDGLQDICYVETNSGDDSTIQCYLNKGDYTFYRSPNHSVKLHGEISDKEAGKLQLVDITSDGLADLCEYDEALTRYHCRVNYGKYGFKSIYSEAEHHIYNIAKDDNVSFIDTNQNGITDICVSKYVTGQLTCNEPDYSFLKYIAKPKRLSRAITGMGFVTEVVYETRESSETLVTQTKSPEDFYSPFPKTQPLVASIVSQNASGSLSRVKYEYSNYKLHPVEGGKGFEEIISTYEYRGLDQHDIETVKATYLQGQYDAGSLKESSKTIGTNQVEKNINTFETVITDGLDGSKYFNLFTTRSEKESTDLSGQLIELSIKEFQNLDSNSGQPETLIETTRKGTDEDYIVTTNSVFRAVVAPSTTKTGWLVGKPINTTVQHAYAGSATSKSMSFSYKEDGSLASQLLAEGTDKQIQTSYKFDSNGQQIQTAVSAIKDSSGNTEIRTTNSAIAYQGVSASTRYINEVTVTDDLNYSSRTVFDPLCKLPSLEVAANGTETKYTYDSLCRKIRQDNADSTFTTWRYEWANGTPIQADWAGGVAIAKNLPTMKDRDVAVTKTVVQSFYGIGAPLSAESVTYYDALGREVRTETIGFDGRKIFTDKVYNARGLLKREARPYYENGAHEGVVYNAQGQIDQGDLIGIEANWMTTTYDVLGRPVRITSPREGGLDVVEYSYAGAETTTTVNGRQTKVETQNSLGELKNVVDSIGNRTEYAYSADKNLLKTVNLSADGISQEISNSYDVVGNKVSTTDPAMGTWTYSYNGFGELLKQIDAKGQYTSIEYDVLGRKIGSVQNSVSLIYDYRKGMTHEQKRF
ncbi:FG-GAP-like repeat-containing protein [Thiomicrorhabdus sp.]|uniref:FG-GAP-like repeat-containing protein n=1 Tax=Thiomicrorhabdus sp. TaxID=2039724 RepID=UPI0029C60854|nr:FG-GAP-like repeat-containing protein [Thiomicrorhabdus sp.]